MIGVAGAGIAFALQEIIASFAGWFAIALSNFYRTGDRVQLGGIKGDVIDIGVLRTTLMEVGEWVKGDLYTGLQLLRRFPVPLGRDHAPGEVRHGLEGSAQDAHQGGRRGGR